MSMREGGERVDGGGGALTRGRRAEEGEIMFAG
jgi:hypothetical protein